MRHLHTLENADAAHALAECLYGAGIDAEARESADSGTAIWVLDETDMPRARALLEEFERSPSAPRLVALRREAAERRRATAAKRRASRHKEVDVRSRWRTTRRSGTASLALIGICVVVFLLTETGDKLSTVQWFTIATVRDVATGHPFGSILSGQVWRLLTPVFIHFGLPHIFFNMLWLNDLGSALEAHRGSVFLLIMVAIIGVGSNLSQFVLGDTWHFGGMSGVVYGMLGYVWLRGRFDPRSGLQLSRPIVILMLGWMALGFFGLMNMANIAHLSGLVMGSAWGYLSSGHLMSRFRA